MVVFLSFVLQNFQSAISLVLERIPTDHERSDFVETVEKYLLVPLSKGARVDDRRWTIWRRAKTIGLAHEFPRPHRHFSYISYETMSKLLQVLQPRKYRAWCKSFRDPVRTGLFGLESCTATEVHTIRRGLCILRIALEGIIVEKQSEKSLNSSSSAETSPDSQTSVATVMARSGGRAYPFY